MKVGTDSVVLGAWVRTIQSGYALDIGTGTGLLALMLAQRTESLHVDAIEIDPEAANQARENISSSKFSGRINLINLDFNEFYSSAPHPYDLIVCNPPYFTGSFKPGLKGRSMARHDDSLDLESIIKGSGKILTDDGMLGLVIPAGHKQAVLSIAETQNLYPERILNMATRPGIAHKRICIELSRKRSVPLIMDLMIEEWGRHGYSDEYRELTREFYLKF